MQSKDHTIVKWNGDVLSFDAELQGHTFSLDADEKHGGSNAGPRPKSLLLTALAGCTGMDVIALLRKMGTLPDHFSVEVNGELREAHPRIYRKIDVLFKIKGGAVPRENVEKAVSLSKERFCGVSAMLKETCELGYEIVQD